MQPRLILLDADGVLWRGAEVIPQAPAFIRRAQAAGIRCVLVSNNAGPDRAAYLAKCLKLGLAFAEHDIFSVNYLAGPFIAQRYPDANVLVVGSEELTRSMREHCNVTSAEEWLAARGVPALSTGHGRAVTPADMALIRHVRSDLVFVGIDHNVNYLKLALACVAVQHGAGLIGANQDLTFPVEEGLLLPGNGASVRLIECVTGAQARFIGKPESPLINQIELETGCRRREMVMVGDRIATDIVFAQRAGVEAYLVLTGVTAAEAVPPNYTDATVAATLDDVARDLGLPEEQRR